MGGLIPPTLLIERNSKMEEKEVKTTKTTTRKKTPAKVSQQPVEEVALQEQLQAAEKEKSETLKLVEQLNAEIDNMKSQQPQYIIQSQGINDTQIEIGCRLFCGAVLMSPSGEIEISLKCGEEVEVTIREMQEIFRSTFGYKKLFEKGVLYFVDPEMYDHFKVRNPIDLSEDALVEHLLNEDYTQMIKFLKDITNDRREDMICHTICYNTALLYMAGKLDDWSYANRNNFESYMKVKVDDVAKSIKSTKKVGLV